MKSSTILRLDFLVTKKLRLCNFCNFDVFGQRRMAAVGELIIEKVNTIVNRDYNETIMSINISYGRLWFRIRKNIHKFVL